MIELLLILWAVFGMLLVTEYPAPKRRSDAIALVIVGGPISWAVFGLLGLLYFLQWLMRE